MAGVRLFGSIAHKEDINYRMILFTMKNIANSNCCKRDLSLLALLRALPLFGLLFCFLIASVMKSTAR